MLASAGDCYADAETGTTADAEAGEGRLAVWGQEIRHSSDGALSVGLGDAIIASGLARGAHARGKRVAFGDGERIIWAPQDYEILRLNPNVAKPGEERRDNLEWCPHYRGHRLYGDVVRGRWLFRDFECLPGEIFFDAAERHFADRLPPGPFVAIEPRVKSRGACDGANKQWPVERYEALAEALTRQAGIRAVQFVPPATAPLLRSAETIVTPTFRHALAALGKAALYVGPEGGLHHGAAAVATPAVVIFGGFNTPRSTGYRMHENITVGEPCGTIARCAHCAEAMRSISVERVLEGAMRQLGQREAA